MLDFLDNIEIRVGGKHCRIHSCLVREEDTDGQNDEGGQPHANPRRDFATFGHLFANDGNHKIESKKDDGNHQRDTDSPFTDNGAERGADEKEEETGQCKGEFPVPFNLIGKQQKVVNINDIERRTAGVHYLRGALGGIL